MNQELNYKAKTALKAETKRNLSEKMEPEKNITLTRFFLLGSNNQNKVPTRRM